MLKQEINTPLRDDQFGLEQPPGAEVVRLDQPLPRAAAPPQGETAPRKIILEDRL